MNGTQVPVANTERDIGVLIEDNLKPYKHRRTYPERLLQFCTKSSKHFTSGTGTCLFVYTNSMYDAIWNIDPLLGRRGYRETLMRWKKYKRE